MTQLGIDKHEYGGGFAPAMRSRFGILLGCASLFTLITTPAAFANDGQKTIITGSTDIKAALGPSLPAATETASARDFNLQLPSAQTTRLLDLNLEFDSLGCFAGEQSCLTDAAPVNMGFRKSISKKSKKGLDVELVPSASLQIDEEGRSAAFGAVVRIGDDLRANNVDSNTWYVFAGADAEALSYDSETSSGLSRGEFALSDRMLIGDAQAGVGYRMGSADVSLGYIRREVTSFDGGLSGEGFSRSEDAAALSFTWKR